MSQYAGIADFEHDIATDMPALLSGEVTLGPTISPSPQPTPTPKAAGWMVAVDDDALTVTVAATCAYAPAHSKR